MSAESAFWLYFCGRCNTGASFTRGVYRLPCNPPQKKTINACGHQVLSPLSPGMYRLTITIGLPYLDLAYFGGIRQYILPSLSPSQPVIADESIICWGTFLNLFAFFAPQAQHSTVNTHKQQKQVRADQSATTQAGRQRWLEPACRGAFTQLAVFSKRKKSKSARPTKIYNHCNHSQSSLLAGVMFACKLLFLSVLSIPSMHAASGLFSWTIELLAFASRRFCT